MTDGAMTDTAITDTAITNCVCGHQRDDHATQPMSVELTANPDPIYPAGKGAMHHFNASYDHDLCHCGCTIFTEDGRG